MSSCTTSSNIQSTLLTQIIREETDTKRVAFKITSADAGISAGVTAGSVIRYDVATDSYLPSKADNPATAEVIGIVEKIENGVYTVVANGLITYPNINTVINGYTGNCTVLDPGTGGGEGGSDVYFLSDVCAGKLQLLEPSIPGRIVKPVMQRVKVGASGSVQYNGIVLNYIGYEVSQLASSSYQIVGIPGDVTYAKETEAPDGFIDGRNEKLLPVDEYPELFDEFKTDYGVYEEKITLDTGDNVDSLTNTQITQKSGSVTVSTGIVVGTDETNKTITVQKDKSQPKTDITKSLYVGVIKYDASSSDVTSFTLPGVKEETITYVTGNETKEEPLIPYIRTKPNLTTVSIPNNIIVNELSSDKITTNNIEVGTKLINLEDRIKEIENKFGI
jgi:hypothetical protein